MTQGRQEQYWDGALWVYHANITNDGSNSGTHVYTVVPGTGDEMEFLYGALRNDDAVTRTGRAQIVDDDDNLLTGLIQGEGLGIEAAEEISFPSADAPAGAGSSAGAGARFIIAGGMKLAVTLISVAVSQDSAFGVTCRIRGAVPAVILTSPTDAVETVDKNQVF